MQPIRGKMRAMGTPVNELSQSSKPTPSTAVSAQIAVHDFHNSIGHALIQNCNLQSTFSKFKPSPAATDDSLDEMLSSIPSFPELIQCHWDLADGTQVAGDEGLPFEGLYDESSLLAAWFRQQQIISEGSLVGIQTMLPISAQLQQHQLLLSAGGQDVVMSVEQSTRNPLNKTNLFSYDPITLHVEQLPNPYYASNFTTTFFTENFEFLL